MAEKKEEKAGYRICGSGTGSFPPGLSIFPGGVHLSVTRRAEKCSVIFFGEGQEPVRIDFPAEYKTGDVWEMTVLGSGFSRLNYVFEADGELFPDPCGKSFPGKWRWGDELSAKVPAAAACGRAFTWKEGSHRREDVEIIYRAHVRGFTMHPSSGVRHPGTFRGLTEKIPYLKQLGITTIELLPVAEFCELPAEPASAGQKKREGLQAGPAKINYWGYTEALAFAPKAAYAGEGMDPVWEFKHMVQLLHQAGIEVIVEMYFSGAEPPSYVLDAARYWVREYHINGIHLAGFAPKELLVRDPFLAKTRIISDGWSDSEKAAGGRRLYVANDDFQTAMRRVIKGDEEQMRSLAYFLRANPTEYTRINYMASTNGFTLADSVAYEQKHNEANGEQGRDGCETNHTWNCGAEGPTNRRQVKAMRARQLRNALILLFLSQGTPLILAGDEFGQTQLGNNNAYCQDNGTAWVDWNLKRKNSGQFRFVKALIAFRKSHPVFHRESEPRLMDYLACGYPDMSFHGERAFLADYAAYSRRLGIYYCGNYAKLPDGECDDFFFLAVNMHSDPHDLALPNLPKGLSWRVAADSSSAASAFDGQGEKIQGNPKKIRLPGRTIMLLESSKAISLTNTDKAYIKNSALAENP